MKKSLTLKSETVRTLHAAHLRAARGGEQYDTFITACVSMDLCQPYTRDSCVSFQRCGTGQD